MARQKGKAVFSISAGTGPISSEKNWTTKLADYAGTIPNTGVEFVSLDADGADFDTVVELLRKNAEVYPAKVHRVFNFEMPELLKRLNLSIKSVSSMLRDACQDVRGTTATLSLFGQLAMDLRTLMANSPEDCEFTLSLNVQGNKRTYKGTHADVPKARGRKHSSK